MNSEYLSKDGHEKIKKELEYLKTGKRKEIAERIKHAKSFGDLSENAEYKESLEARSLLEDRIEKLDDIIKRAVIVEKRAGSTVQFGSTIKLKKENDSKIYEYVLVGTEESDLARGKISNQSPIGAAVIGKKKGDAVFVSVPSGEIKYTVMEIL